MSGSVSAEIQKGIATIEFFHPKGNSLPSHLLDEIAEQISSTGKDDSVKVIVLKSAGEGAFCAGASFDELIDINNYEVGKKFFMGFGKVILAMKNCPKLIITRVHGKAVGGGLGIIAASDYAIASNSAFVKLSELSLGIGPFVIAPVVTRKIGLSAFSTLSIDARKWQSAEWAFKKGLFNTLTTSVSELDNEVNRLAEDLAGSSPDAMQEIKLLTWIRTDDLDELLELRAEISGRLVLSDFTKNFISEFKKGN